MGAAISLSPLWMIATDSSKTIPRLEMKQGHIRVHVIAVYCRREGRAPFQYEPGATHSAWIQ